MCIDNADLRLVPADKDVDMAVQSSNRAAAVRNHMTDCMKCFLWNNHLPSVLMDKERAPLSQRKAPHS